MNGLRVGRPVLGVLVAMAMPAGCGGVGTTASVPTAMTTAAHHATSSYGDLVYVVDGDYDVWMLSFPQGHLVGRLSGISHAIGLCSDAKGNVFVAEASAVLEYAHGGTMPINTLSARDATACSWDPSTGNLAVVEPDNSLEIFAHASGEPTVYADSNSTFQFCAYDPHGNLFLAGLENSSSIIKFANGEFSTISLNQKFNGLEDLQWDGTYLAIDDFWQSGNVYRVKVSGSTGTVEQTVTLSGGQFYRAYTWIQGHTFISPIFTNNGRRTVQNKNLRLFPYPSGGNPKKQFSRKYFEKAGIAGITVSVAPSQSRIRK